MKIEDLDISVAHWHIKSWGGAEYLVTKLADAVNVDTVYTVGDPDPDSSNPYGDIEFEDVTPSLDYSAIRSLQRSAGRVFEYSQWEDVDWRSFGNPDVLITSGATTRAVITPDDTLHVNYCHSPPRWFYDLYHDRKGSLSGILARPLIRHLRTRDMAVDPRVDYYFVNSPIIERRLWKYYKRSSEVMYPPVDLEKYYNEGDHGYFLHLGRLDNEKGVPEVVKAFESLDENLVMAGGMGDIDDSISECINQSENIEWHGFVDEDEKLDLLAHCTAVVFNGRNEDFGIVPIEANASGKPVLARNEGFPGIFVEEGGNGYLHKGTEESIRNLIENYPTGNTEPISSGYVSSVSYEAFKKQLHSSIKEVYDDFQNFVRQ